jgi:hypothetical protein
MLGAAFGDRPFGSHGQFTPPPAPVPQPAPLQSFTPPPPDWEAELRERHADAREDFRASEQPRVSAVEAMMANAAALGELEEPPPLGPPALQVTPLERFRPPEPDWQKEEAAAIARKAQERLQEAHKLVSEEQPSRYPPATRRTA